MGGQWPVIIMNGPLMRTNFHHWPIDCNSGAIKSHELFSIQINGNEWSIYCYHYSILLQIAANWPFITINRPLITIDGRHSAIRCPFYECIGEERQGPPQPKTQQNPAVCTSEKLREIVSVIHSDFMQTSRKRIRQQTKRNFYQIIYLCVERRSVEAKFACVFQTYRAGHP